MKQSLAGQRIAITGAARGMGELVARTAANKGATVALVGIENERLQRVAEEIGSRAMWTSADVRDSQQLSSAIDECAETMGGIDIVVANAGVAGYGTVRQVDSSAFERVIDINLNGVFRTLRCATPHLADSRGHAVVMSSAIAFTPLMALASYAASKAGVEALALSYRAEVAHLGITVGLVHPAFIDTDLIRDADSDLPSFKKMRRKLPYPANTVTKPGKAAGSIIRSLERRSSRAYIPRAMIVANWTRAFVNSPVLQPYMKRLAMEYVGQIEREVEVLGRHEQLPH